MSQDILLSGLADLARHPTLLAQVLLAKKVEGRSPRTLEWYCDSVEDIKRFFHRRAVPFDLEQLNPHYFRAWVSDMQDRGLSENTVNTHFRSLRSMLNWSKTEGIIAKTPFENIRAPKVARRLIPLFQPEHVRALLTLCPPNTWWGARDRAIILVLLNTGIRRAELVGLKLSDVDMERSVITVTGKGDKQRRVYLDPEALKALLQYVRRRKAGGDAFQESNYLFVTMKGSPLTGNGIELMLNKLGKRAAVTGVRCSAHTFRHTFAVAFLRNGGDLRHLQEIMGHTSMKPLETYLRTVSAEDAIEKHKQVRPFKSWGL